MNLGKFFALATLLVLAMDTQFKYVYGRAFFVEMDSIILNLGILSVVLVFCCLIYCICVLVGQRRWHIFCRLIAFLIAFGFVQNYFGEKYLVADKELSDNLVKIFLKNPSVNWASFESQELAAKWREEGDGLGVDLIGSSPFHNLFTYKISGRLSYVVFVATRPEIEIRVSSFH